MLLEWGIAGDRCFYVTSKKHEAAAYEIVGESWVIVHIGKNGYGDHWCHNLD